MNTWTGTIELVLQAPFARMNLDRIATTPAEKGF